MEILVCQYCSALKKAYELEIVLKRGVIASPSLVFENSRKEKNFIWNWPELPWWVKFSTAVDVSTSVLAQVPAAVALGGEETSCMYSLRSRPTDNIIYLDINDDKYHFYGSVL